MNYVCVNAVVEGVIPAIKGYENHKTPDNLTDCYDYVTHGSLRSCPTLNIFYVFD